MKSRLKLGGVFYIWCYGPDGDLKWEDIASNIVVNEGLDYILNILLKGGVQSDPWYIGLTNGAPSPAAGDQLTGTHAGWAEVTAYSEGLRQEFVDDAISGQSIDNSVNKAEFSINSDSTTIGGAFLTNDSTTGANGMLLCVAAFDGGNKTADDGDVLAVQYIFSAADDGV